jgi:15-hydroxyprostaglandin dehydrogenase (NAD)
MLSPVYCASKFGVVGFSRSLGEVVRCFILVISIAAANLGSEGIRVNCICPTFIKTPLIDDAFEKNEAFRQYVESFGMLRFFDWWLAVVGLISRSVDHVVKGLLMLVEDDSKCGEVMRVTQQRGIDYQSYLPGGTKAKL